MTPLAAFRPRIADHVAGAADPGIDRAVLDTCVDFCEKSSVVRRMVNTVPTVDGTREYALAPTADESVCKVIRMWVDSKELVPLDDESIATPFAFVTSVSGQSAPKGQPSYFTESAPGAVSLYPVPERVYQVNARCAFRPLRAATQVADILFEDWVEAICNGAIARLLMAPGEAQNPGLAKAHGGAYIAELNRAMLEARRGSTRAQQRVTPIHI